MPAQNFVGKLSDPNQTERTKWVVCTASQLVANCQQGQTVSDRSIGYMLTMAAASGALPMPLRTTGGYNLLFNDIRTACEMIQGGLMSPGSCLE